MTSTRICQAPGCLRSIQHLRPQAKTCGDECRKVLYQSRKRSGLSDRTVSLAGEEGYFDALDSTRGYLGDWRPQRKTQILLGQVQHILEEYADQLPLTCRQVYYRMVAEFRRPKGKQFERQLYEALDRGRRAEVIRFEDIRDDGILGGGWWPTRWGQPIETWAHEARNYQRDRQEGQPGRLQVWCEAGGMVPQLAKVADRYSIPVYSSGGFSSLTAIRQIVDSCVQDGNGPTALLHLGDCDPSGYSIFQAVYEDVAEFLKWDRRYPEQTFSAERVAITFDQIAEHELVVDEIQTNDSRSREWRRRGITHKVELEALAPDVIARLLTEAIERHVDRNILEQVRKHESADRARLWGVAMRARDDWRAVERAA